ncbi:MAG: N-acetylmuramoyl-L-alanine amidase [Verrucomicrobiota bacterium]|nr:N-acetylmuramoyl-L-alanine amidase [Verrucomicrobiota bacterium]
MKNFLRLVFVSVLAVIGLQANALAQNRFTTVVIDAGHGGFDRGGISGQRASEKDATLSVALRLRTLLAGAGYRVILTRGGDYFVTLGNRVGIANSQRNAIFVSIHFNSAPRTGADGIETYFYSTESAPLASSIHRNVLSVARTENRGVRRRGYYVLRQTSIPAVLVECGFLTNYAEAQRCLNPAYQQRLAEAIARGIEQLPVVAQRSSFTNRSSAVNVGQQPFLDQRYMRGSGSSSHKHARSSKKKKSSSKSGKKSSTSKKKKKAAE